MGTPCQNTPARGAIGSMPETCAADIAWILSALKQKPKMKWSNKSSREKLPYIWTSGRMCDFKGCENRTDLEPLIVNGWFWPANQVQLAPTDKIPPGWSYQPWSPTGHFKRSQPDNAEFSINNTTEACLGVLNNVYKDGIQWHDIACYHTKAVICEDSPTLLNFVRRKNPQAVL